MTEYTTPDTVNAPQTALETNRESTNPPWQRRFLALLPNIQQHAKICFRHVSPELREELVQETIARALLDFLRLVERNKEHDAYAGPIARYAVAQVRQGRRVGGRLNVRDVSSEYCRRRKRVWMESLDRYHHTSGGWHELVVEDRNAGPAEVAATRLDVGDWLRSLPGRNRRLAEQLATGESTSGAARMFGITSGRVAQLRRELHGAWCSFQGEPVPATA